MRERHWTIQPAIGVFKEEEDALELLNLLSWLMPAVVFVASFIDCFLVLIYQAYLHPWKRILVKVAL